VPWTYRFTETALKEFTKLNRQVQKEVIRYLDDRIATPESPERFGKPLRGDKWGSWRYRIGDYRLVCKIERSALIVLVLHVGHRSRIYD
jgi:mRNA interferase RelE/StbE